MHAGDRVADADNGDRLRRGLLESSPGQADLRAEHGLYMQPSGVAAKETAGVFRSDPGRQYDEVSFGGGGGGRGGELERQEKSHRRRKKMSIYRLESSRPLPLLEVMVLIG